MKKILLLIILLFTYSNIQCQVDTLVNTPNQATVPDSGKISLKNEVINTPDSVKDNATVKPVPKEEVKTSAEKTNTEKKTTTSVKRNNTIEKSFPTIEAVKNINFYTLLNIILLLIVGLAFVKLIDTQPLGKNFYYYNHIKIFLKVVVWLLVFYLILNLLIEESDNVIIYIIIATTVIFAISTISFFKNIVGGFYISLNQPFQVGDYIRINSFEGEVEELNWRETTLRTIEAGIILVPNSYFLIYPLENINKGQTEQIVSMKLFVSSNIEPEEAKRVISEAALSSPFTFLHKEPKVFFIEYDMISKFNKYELQVFVKEGKYENHLIDSINMAVSKYLNSK